MQKHEVYNALREVGLEWGDYTQGLFFDLPLGRLYITDIQARDFLTDCIDRHQRQMASLLEIRDCLEEHIEAESKEDVLQMGGLLEKVAELEHEQWAHWTRYMLDNLTPENIERWRGQVDTSYAELSEKEKDSDREWAGKVLEIIDEALDEYRKYLVIPKLSQEEL